MGCGQVEYCLVDLEQMASERLLGAKSLGGCQDRSLEAAVAAAAQGAPPGPRRIDLRPATTDPCVVLKLAPSSNWFEAVLGEHPLVVRSEAAKPLLKAAQQRLKVRSCGEMGGGS